MADGDAAMAELEPDEDDMTGFIEIEPVPASIYVRPVEASEGAADTGPAPATPAPPAAATPVAAAAAAPPTQAQPPLGTAPSGRTADQRLEPGPAMFDDPEMDWTRDDDPFADLGPADSDSTGEGPAKPSGR